MPSIGLKTTIVIATMNRPDDLGRLLNSIGEQSLAAAQVVVVDQSDDNKTENFIEILKNSKNLPLFYLRGSFKSLTKARNLGLKHVTTPLTTFLDDDVEIGPEYLAKVISFFEENKVQVLGGIPWTAGLNQNQKLESPGRLWSLYRRVFGLGYPTNAWRVGPSFEGTFDPNIHEVTDSQWISGSNFSVRTDTAREFGWDENLLGYGIGEDLDFPMRVLEKYPGQVKLDPTLPVQHHSSQVARLDNAKTQLMKACHFYYLFEKHKHRRDFSKLAFFWSRLGLVLMPSLQVRTFKIFPDPRELLKSLRIEAEVLLRRHEIKKGIFPYEL